MDRRKVILDVDTGSDDAVAIMTALLSPELEVLGICTVNGNRCIEMTTENTLRVVEYLGSDVPVFKGCHLPLVSSLTPGRRPHMPFTGQEDPEENVHSDYLDYLPAATIESLTGIAAQVDEAAQTVIVTLPAAPEEAQ